MSQNTVATAFEFKHAVVDISVDSTEVSTQACILRGAYINTALSAHALPIQDGASAVFTIPASAAAGQFYNFADAVFENGITVDPNDAATGSVTLIYKPRV